MKDTFFWNGFEVRIDSIEDCESYVFDEPKIGDKVFLRVRCETTIIGKEKAPEGWSEEDPVPNVYVDEIVECPRHPDPNNSVSAKRPRSK